MKTIQQWFDYLNQLNPNKIDLGLDRIKKVYKRLSINKIAKKTIIVAGTNGKGSTLSYLESILFHSGYSVAKYTSPHLFCFNERIVINQRPVSDDLLLEAFNYIEQKRQDTFLTYFEFTTLAAIYCIYKSKVDVTLMEIGLGGRLDAVNILYRDVNIITNIELDHQDWLGQTRNQIALEKLAIAKKQVPLVIADTNPPMALIENTAQQQFPVYWINQDFFIDPQKGLYKDDFMLLKSLKLSVYPPWQLNNIAASLQVVSLLIKQGFNVNQDKIQPYLQKAALFGRQSFCSDQKTNYLFDVAHNIAAIEVLKATLEQTSFRKCYAVFSAMSDKDITSMIRMLSNSVDYWYITSIDNERSLSGDALANHFHDCNQSNFEVCLNAKSALICAQKQANEEDLLVVFGSFYLLAELEEEINRVCYDK